jgi:hypothetical protein
MIIPFPLLKRIVAWVAFAGLPLLPAAGQDRPPVLQWLDAKTLPVEGKGWTDTKSFFDRLPRSAEGVVRAPVWDHSHETAGMLYHFSSDTPELRVRWTLTSSELALHTLPATSTSGLDLYVKLDTGWHWMAAVRPGNTREGNSGVFFEQLAAQKREFLLYLPLYNGIESLEFGIPASRKLEPVARTGKPIVIYGTSITQGGNAMRPGMAYPALLGRHLDREVINLGFSGNGKAEPEVATFLAELDPAAYVLDCLPNLSSDQVKRVEPFVGLLRKKHPVTPIFLMENLEYPDGAVIPARKKLYVESNQNLREIYERLGYTDPNLYYISARDLLGSDGEATVDGIHPTDLGIMRMVEKMEPILRRVLPAP